MAKNRSDNQRLEDLSRGKAQVLLSPFVVNELENDFGLDLEVALTEEDTEDVQEVTAQNFYIQLKASNSFEGDKAKFDIRTSDLKFYIRQNIPVILALYDEEADTFYWCAIQEYVWDKLERKKPDWRRQTTFRMKVDKDYTFEDLDILNRTVEDVQKRILRRQNRGLDIGEGVAINVNDFREMDEQIESDIMNYKGHSLLKSKKLMKQGEESEARKIIEEVLQAPKDDEGKVKSILARMFFIDPMEPESARQVLKLSGHGIELAEELEMIGDEQYLRVQREIAKLYLLLDKQRDIAIMASIQEEATYSGDDVLASLSIEERELLEKKLEVSTELNNALAALLDEGLFFEYATCLSDIIDFISRQLMGSVALRRVDRDTLSEREHPFVEQAEQILDFLPEREEAYNLHKSLALYRHHTCNPDTALVHAEKCVELAEMLEDQRLIPLSRDLVEKIENEPDPYAEFSNPDAAEDDRDLEMGERQDMMKTLVEQLGHNVEDPANAYDRALRQGIEDADPTEYFRYCEHLRMRYYTTNQLGKATGVHTLGEKVMWCGHGGHISGTDLESMFSEFKSAYCEDCKYHSPRSDDWTCTFGWYEDQIEFENFSKFLEEYEEEHFTQEVSE
ncbi:DUF4365 domain-containing protein [Natrialba asiatica]|uniref:DUF4365 domain-containing protein n=1 Tax=Natrialba asiatica (strain ATCC 700177 / DSM 12278 / JCM 9576 / FERM P-10747 / NBRC 102637 / 172P1) TaxID=29540 RepID=M0ANF1_NATA1|nr:DUF4365 domain-containing protein [Natrialba asiatica]ELY99462.1 hypothetical protein C481_14553 [Natrialba asiatica DSM 12278]